MLKVCFWSTLVCAVTTVATGQGAHAQSAAPFSASVSAPSAAQAFGPVKLQARVCDRQGVPVSGLLLRFRIRLDGQAKQADGTTAPYVEQTVREVLTSPNGIATVYVAPPFAKTALQSWFRGEVRADVAPAPKAIEVSPVNDVPLHIMQSVPAANSGPYTSDVPTLTVFDLPTQTVDGFPFWAARNGSTKKIVVLVEGFDLNNDTTATDSMRLIAPAADALRQHGVSLLVVNFKNSHIALDDLVPETTSAVQAASRLSGGKVVVAGLSMGGLVARYALCAAEKAGTPLPVSSLLLLDTPNRGATINPGLQAITMRYGTKADQGNLTNPAARALLDCVPSQIKWKQVGIAPPVAGRLVPASWMEDTHYHDEFMARLRTSGGKNGYPTQCRVVAVANSSRRIAPTLKGDLLHLWLPGDSWTLHARPQDHAPGSLMPPFYVNRYALIYPFGIAGSYLRSAPTFVSCESALDAAPNETPPFDAWFARPDNLTPLPHDVVDANAAAFTVREILSAKWD